MHKMSISENGLQASNTSFVPLVKRQILEQPHDSVERYGCNS